MAEAIASIASENPGAAILVCLGFILVYYCLAIIRPFQATWHRLFFFLAWVGLVLMVGSLGDRVFGDHRTYDFYFIGIALGSPLVALVWVGKLLLCRSRWGQKVLDRYVSRVRPSRVSQTTIPFFLQVMRIPSTASARVLMDALEEAPDDVKLATSRIVQLGLSMMCRNEPVFVCLVCGHPRAKWPPASPLAWCEECGSRAWFFTDSLFPALFYHVVVRHGTFEAPAKCVCCLKPAADLVLFGEDGRARFTYAGPGEKVAYGHLPCCRECQRHDVKNVEGREIKAGRLLPGHSFFRGLAAVRGKAADWSEIKDVLVSFQNPSYAKKFHELNGQRRCPRCKRVLESLGLRLCPSCSRELDTTFDYERAVHVKPGLAEEILRRSHPCPTCALWLPSKEVQCRFCGATSDSRSLW